MMIIPGDRQIDFICLNFGTKKRSEINELQPQALIHIAREIRTFRPFDAQLIRLIRLYGSDSCLSNIVASDELS